jgi:5,10-methylenetetrahydromethanopterin reductase
VVRGARSGAAHQLLSPSILARPLEEGGMEASPRTGVALRESLPWHDLVQVVETAEETGYEIVLVPEIRGREAFATLAGFASTTTSIRLGSGVVPITSRPAALTAMGAATVNEASGGRFVLGLGSGRARRVETIREYVRRVRRALAGDEVDGGEGFRGFRLTMDPGPGPIPLWLAALGPRVTELAGEVADAALLNWCTPERVAKAREEVARGAEGAGRDPAKIRIAVYVRTCLGHEESRALEALGSAAVEYARFPTYARQFELMGLGESARSTASGDPSASQSLANALCVWGSRDQALMRFGEWWDAGADLVVVYPVPVLESQSSILGTVLAAAPRPAVER